ncbi:ribulokinase [Verrucomicrobiaceae bacterium N1E253]|uniref:Ribulokinase n=1 Tax=Oceaniferula marina TaxID=2748318 RepID=A0A851GEL2_9BACT|nr:ribulokinase [Oceaniferula marina]NWK55619.1 ribulokinase [Oceaniferula marina]
MSFVIGLDYGTNSCRAVVVCCDDGVEIGTGVYGYPSGDEGILLDQSDVYLARQHPGDYLRGAEKAIKLALNESKACKDFQAEKVVGIGIDSTGSSPLPVNSLNQALGMSSEFEGNLSAQCWLWKDHTSHEEAATITDLARTHRPHFVAKCGNVYSSEWWWSKIWHCLKVDQRVFDSAYSWVELCDWVPSVLAGIEDPKLVKRSVCAAGHKALYSDEWGGLPDKEFLEMLDPRLAELRDRLYEKAYDASQTAGYLCSAWAKKLGLNVGIPISMGLFDVHFGAVGCGIQEGTLVKVIGTSTCDCAIVKADKAVEDIPGICGKVLGSILPGYYGIEAGQSAVGDIFKWWVETVCQGDATLHREMTEDVESMSPGESGLMALDWNNGNRTVLVDQRLTGALIGQTLHTTRSEIYRALVEATAFGARMILERIEEYGVKVERIVCAGGIAEKNAMLMQIYADVTGREVCVSQSSQTCALGAAVGAAVIAGVYPDFSTAQEAMTRVTERAYTPDQQNHETYTRLFGIYRDLHDGFGKRGGAGDLYAVMKDLITIKEEISK